MPDIFHIRQVADYNRLRGAPTPHPLVSVIDFARLEPAPSTPPPEPFDAMHFGCYAVYLKQGPKCRLRYGRRDYDFQDGTLVFLSPGQTVHVDRDAAATPPASGHALLFHPDLLAGTPLADGIHDYRFFSYEAAEGLHVSEAERATVLDCLSKIGAEASSNIDQHSRRLIVSTLQLLLDYSQRFYGRQFHTRFRENADVVTRFEQLLRDYFAADRAREAGIPTVGYFAAELHLSANYFGDLVRAQVGRSPRDLIQDRVIELARQRLTVGEETVSEVAYGLGFKHPQHFTRLFRKRVGAAPGAWRAGFQ